MKASIWEIISFFAIQYALGRRGSFPYGLLVKLTLLEISVLVVISDMIQTFLLLNFAGFLRKHLHFLNTLKKKLRKNPFGAFLNGSITKQEQCLSQQKKFKETWL